VCMDGEASMIILPCFHLVLCEICPLADIYQSKNSSCPNCRGTIEVLRRVKY
jgi:hypothetical protein